LGDHDGGIDLFMVATGFNKGMCVPLMCCAPFAVG